MRKPQDRTNMVQFSTFAGIDVFTDPNAVEPSITFALLDDETDPILNLRVWADRADINVDTARNLAAALNRFADQHSPRDQTLGIRLHGIEYPQANQVIETLDKTHARAGVEQQNKRGYIGTDGQVYRDIRRVEASVYPEWETVED